MTDKQALCCICGTLRRCSRPRNYRSENYWLRQPADGDWHRETGDLKCETCGRITKHAIILPPGDTWRDHAERIRLAATGWTFTREQLDAQDLQRIQERWRQGLPRNPYAHHMWWLSEEEKARQAGQTHFSAICKTLIPVRDSTAAVCRSSGAEEFVEPREFHDVDREDPATGLWWFDVDCVDCLSRANAIALTRQREALKDKLLEIAAKVNSLDAASVTSILGQFKAAEEAE